MSTTAEVRKLLDDVLANGGGTEEIIRALMKAGGTRALFDDVPRSKGGRPRKHADDATKHRAFRARRRGSDETRDEIDRAERRAARLGDETGMDKIAQPDEREWPDPEVPTAGPAGPLIGCRQPREHSNRCRPGDRAPARPRYRNRRPPITGGRSRAGFDQPGGRALSCSTTRRSATLLTPSERKACSCWAASLRAGSRYWKRLREKLRSLGYLPTVFNFDKPETKNFTETVRLLANLCPLSMVEPHLRLLRI
jgi:hypothetical protein